LPAEQEAASSILARRTSAPEPHSSGVDRAAAEEWIRAHVEPVGPIEVAHERPWATVLRVPLADSVVWFKACAPVQNFEPRLTAQLFARWPDRVAEVVSHDEERAWLLLADAGNPIGQMGNPPEVWMEALPLYAELQRGESAHALEHVTHGRALRGPRSARPPAPASGDHQVA
jgi:hypothetical protein